MFVTFRSTRLALARGVARLDEAMAMAEELRRTRFHDREAVFIVKHPGGEIIRLPTPPKPRKRTRKPPTPRAAKGPAEAPGKAAAAPSPAPAPSPPPEAPARREIPPLAERADRLRRVSARALEANRRYDRALAERREVLARSESLLEPPRLSDEQRLRDLGDLTRSAADAVARTASLLEQRLAAGTPAPAAG